MEAHREPLAQGFRLARQHAQRSVDALGRRMQRRVEHHVAAMDRLVRDALAGEVEGAAVAGAALLGLAVLRVDGAHARRDARRADHKLVADPHPSGQYRSRHHRAGAGEREGAVDGEAEAPFRRARGKVPPRRDEPGAQIVDPLAGHGRDRHDLRPFQRGAVQQRGDFRFHLGAAVLRRRGPPWSARRGRWRCRAGRAARGARVSAASPRHRRRR